MKKLLLLSFAIATGVAYSQDDADKKLQAGLGFSTGLNFNKSTTKNMAKNGVGTVASIGLNVNYNFSSTIGFFTGLDIDFENNKIKPAGEAATSYYVYNDTKVSQTLTDTELLTAGDLYQWTERKQKAKYLTIPTMLLFRTKFFGDFRYFAKFGLRTSFLLGSKSNDLGHGFDNNLIITPAAESKNLNMEIPADMNPIRSSVGVAFGTEWNFSGPTSLTVELGYYYGFTPIYRKNDGEASIFGDGSAAKKSLFYLDDNFERQYYSNSMMQSQLQLKVAVLF